MKAAVVTTFDQPPRYGDVPTPVPHGDYEQLVDVVACGLHPRVRSQANGSHYTSTDDLPLVPGIDGVGRDADGVLRYFILPDTTVGAMAERTVIDIRRSIALPADIDALAVAAAMNPAMSSWIALRQRIHFEPGQDVLVFGATGNAGQMAVQISKHLGARNIIAAGRNADRLTGLTKLGATELVPLDGNEDHYAANLARACVDVDVVMDYLWGEPTTHAMSALVTARTDRAHPLTWIEIGSIAGPTVTIPSALLRAARLQIIGSGQGSVSNREILQELPELVGEIARGTFDIEVRSVPLSDVETVWTSSQNVSRRIVIVPPHSA